MQIRLKVLTHHLPLTEEEMVWQDAISDAKLPQRFDFVVTPCGAAGNRVLQGSNVLSSTCFQETFAINSDDVEPHVIDAVENPRRVFTPRLREMLLQ